MSHIRLDREGTYNDKGELIDLYIPRKCAATNKIIHAKDKSSVQLNIAEVETIKNKVSYLAIGR